MKKGSKLPRWGVFLITIVLALLVVSRIVSKSTKKTAETFTGKMSSHAKIWVISDTHYLAEQLYDDGKTFQFIKDTAAGKDLTYQQERLEALVWQVEQERPSLLLVSGDLTLNGEKASAQELAGYFSRINDLGTQVYVIPGNHDIADGWAQRYHGNEATKVPQILPKEFSDIFGEMGYAHAFSTDPHSLSYAAKPFKDLLLVMIDTNKYLNTVSYSAPQTSGKLRKGTSDWLEEMFAIGKKEGRQIIPVMHHNLVDHNQAINKGFTIDQAEEVQALFFKHDIKMVLTGHMHAQDIATVTKGNQTIYDIATGAFSILSNSIGEVTIANKQLHYQRKLLDLAEWAQETGQKEGELLAYSEYTKELFQKDGEGMAYRQMFEENWYDEATAAVVAEFVGRMNSRYFDGDDYVETEAELTALKAEAGYGLLAQNPESFLLKYVDGIITKREVDQLRATISLE